MVTRRPATFDVNINKINRRLTSCAFTITGELLLKQKISLSNSVGFLPASLASVISFFFSSGASAREARQRSTMGKKNW